MKNPDTTAKNPDTNVKMSGQIKAHMPVVCSNNGQFATVDHIEGKSVKLTKDDKGQHRVSNVPNAPGAA